MCGRFGLFAPPELLEEYFALSEPPEALPPRYNLTPGQAVAVVRERDGRRVLDTLRWGLVPFWAKEAAIGRRLINARVESLAEKPAFREAWSRRRCLIPANGFYEWSEPQAGRKHPYFIAPSGEPLLALAGLWERWRAPTGERLETCVIVTTDASAELARIHERMPLLVPRSAHSTWLDPHTSLETVTELGRDPPSVTIRRVGFAVNDPHNDDAGLIAAVAERD